MASYIDIPDTALLTLVARLDRDALSEVFRRYATVVLVAVGWTEQAASEAERRTVDVFVDVRRRPEAYAPGVDTTRSLLIRSALRDAGEQAVRLAGVRLAKLEGWTYHDVAEVLARPAHLVALLIQDQLGALRHGDDTPE